MASLVDVQRAYSIAATLYAITVLEAGIGSHVIREQHTSDIDPSLQEVAVTTMVSMLNAITRQKFNNTLFRHGSNFSQVSVGRSRVGSPESQKDCSSAD